MYIAPNAGHTGQNDGGTLQNDGRNTLNVCQGPKGGLEEPPGPRGRICNGSGILKYNRENINGKSHSEIFNYEILVIEHHHISPLFSVNNTNMRLSKSHHEIFYYEFLANKHHHVSA